MNHSTENLSRLIEYQFSDGRTLDMALTHRSAGSRNNERLEFLGDAILNFVVAEALFQQFPAASEGELSRLRASLVKGEVLAVVARELSLGQCLLLGPGELKSGGFRRDSILAGALEAVIGAVYIDGGYEAAAALIQRIFASRLAQVSADKVAKDPKTRLQEFLQSRRLPLPDYRIVEVGGSGHQQTFRVECSIPEDTRSAIGVGASRRKAEQDAASNMLVSLQQPARD